MRSLLATLVAALVITPAAAPAAAPDLDRAERASYPALQVRRLVTGLDHPWDVRPIGGGRLLFTQRDRATLSVWEDGRTRSLAFPSSEVWVSGETGLMGLEVDPDFATNHRVYTCAGGFRAGGRPDVRVVAWRLDDALTRATKLRVLVSGFPTSSVTPGRHGGCRLLIDRRGALNVGTGDAATGANPRNLHSFGGKTLRLDRFSGRPWPSNPFIRSANRVQRYVYTYGHRNVQGLAERADGTLWSVEQGTYRDDEVNRLVRGGDYGYNPVPGYNESVPMTDQRLPGRQRAAVWRSGDPTLATSGGGFVTGPGLGAYDGTLAVAALKASRVLFLTLTADGHLRRVHVPDELRGFGRIRTVVDGPGSTFYVTTDNGGGADAILQVRPSAG
ncbi:PQQ-dependent sugar dehydrogenase [Nocardioides sp. MAH-18]|uniref:PQQ-dependent sugar dehydrogenase n=1 Tax=Nocardioides agri TaxID=2682843 RepID=A0A6L6XVZ9_9ACTN|nr:MULTISPECIES: PQQ-dependent sugar dehydrogenase [unclassified Nocardioides]MBA2952205.1 PQQ-dependent sugar dehydrogenase [Nocardioides sp. CGMCC 1.13656]MVQ51370.1 PQQ-dependent sugar dehydrogenase [Nocardioides sp. MAH-18]